jgi:enoyl-CoA hydratase/carnithine racemase
MSSIELDPDVIRYVVAEGIATITIDRPDRYNALNVDAIVALRQAMLRAGADPEVRVIILTGAGKSFCVGADMGTTGGLDQRSERGKLLQWPMDSAERGDFQTTYGYFPVVPKPVISMINGATAGVGLVFACFSDLRFAAEEAVFATAFARRGMTAEYGIAWILSRLVGHGNATDLLISGRRFTAREALEMGLVNRVVPAAELETTTRAYAADLVQNCSPMSMKVIKHELWEGLLTSLGDAVRQFRADTDTIVAWGDLPEGAASFMEKRPPRFKPLGG